jgi:DUF1365 family protein
MKSCIFEGWVSHRRRTPVAHDFQYRLFMLYLDLSELPDLFEGRWLWSARRPAFARFRRRDHLGSSRKPLDGCVRDLVQSENGRRPDGPIRLLTQLRYCGYGFNPVSFYYCFDAADRNVEAIVAEVNNTPWGEQHCYVLSDPSSIGGESVKRFKLEKEFHVSPFMDMNLSYDWGFSKPADNLVVHMQNSARGVKFFDATLSLERTPITGRSLARALAVYPLMSLKVVGGIYWQALRLWLKGCPVYDHPNKKTPLAVRQQ